MSANKILDEKTLKNALWDAYWHGELDELAKAIMDKVIDGNDRSELKRAARAILGRLPARYVFAGE